MDETALITSARKGDAHAFNQLILLHQSMAYTVAFRMLGDEDAAADATQDAFLIAFRRIHTLRSDSFKSWFLRILTNICYDRLRHRQRRPSVSLDDLDTHEDRLGLLRDPAERPDEQVERRELNQVLQAGIGQLPAQMRVVLVLADIQGLKYVEIAKVTGLELGTIKSRLSRGRARLRDYLRANEDLLPARYRLRKGAGGHAVPDGVPAGQSSTIAGQQALLP